MSETAIRPLSEAERIFKELVWDPALKAGEAALESYVPALRLPVIRNIEEGAVGVVADALYSWIVLTVDVAAIRLVNDAHQRAFDEQAAKLKIISKEKGHDSPEYRTQRAAAEFALAKFVRYGATV